MIIDKHIDDLKEILRSMGRVVIAVSGGMDSAFLAGAARLFQENQMIAVSVSSRFSIRGELEAFTVFAKNRGIPYDILETDILSNDAVRVNGPDRCYHCKKSIFMLIKQYASAGGYGTVCDGSSLSDIDDYRPGRRALEELGIQSPLYSAGFDKGMIKSAAERLGIDLPVKRSNSCLAARVEYGTEITEPILDMIGEAEMFLADMGLEPLRVRYHNRLARIELDENNVRKIFIDDLYKSIYVRLKELGFNFVTIDLEGFRSGSMNIPLIGRLREEKF